MRTSVAVVMAVSVLFVGFVAVSQSAENVESTAVNGSNATHDAYNLSTGVFDNVGTYGSRALVYGGVGAIVVVSLGYLVMAGRRGR
jgi:hypothetical protein